MEAKSWPRAYSRLPNQVVSWGQICPCSNHCRVSQWYFRSVRTHWRRWPCLGRQATKRSSSVPIWKHFYIWCILLSRRTNWTSLTKYTTARSSPPMTNGSEPVQGNHSLDVGYDDIQTSYSLLSNLWRKWSVIAGACWKSRRWVLESVDVQIQPTKPCR